MCGQIPSNKHNTGTGRSLLPVTLSLLRGIFSGWHSGDPRQIKRNPHNPGGQRERNDREDLYPLYQTRQPLGLYRLAA